MTLQTRQVIIRRTPLCRQGPSTWRAWTLGRVCHELETVGDGERLGRGLRTSALGVMLPIGITPRLRLIRVVFTLMDPNQQCGCGPSTGSILMDRRAIRSPRQANMSTGDIQWSVLVSRISPAMPSVQQMSSGVGFSQFNWTRLIGNKQRGSCE